MNALRTLLSDAVDYAGLFPPAMLDMDSAVRNYAAYRAGEYSWALGRFIVPVSRLVEFDQSLKAEGDTGWSLSVLTGPNLDNDVAAIFDFQKRRVSMIDCVESKASTVDDIEAATRAIPSTLTTYVEIPLDPDPSSLIDALGRSGARAKVRTGGVASGTFPSSRSLARFIKACAAANIPFKATAGLHHPIRGTYNLTYEPHSATGMMFGFLNIFIAAGVASNGGSIDDVVAALEEQSPPAFHFNEGAIVWRHHRVEAIRYLRSELAISFGSCSFTEPIEDLKALRLL